MIRPDIPGVSDTELLDRFYRLRDEAAFELLVWRHGPMVLGVCRRVLHDEHEAEDAFQATFVALARGASTLGGVRSVGAWLYTVASRTAHKARARASRRVLVEHPLGDREVAAAVSDPADEATRRDLRQLLEAEVERLPEKYRAVFVLCCVEGKTNEEAAEQLGCPKGTVLSRLARARERLRGRLATRDAMLGALPLGVVFTDYGYGLAKVSSILVNTTVHLSSFESFGTLAAGSAATWTGDVLLKGTVPTMQALNAKILAAVLGLGILTAGAGAYAYSLLVPTTDPVGEPTSVDPTDPGAPPPCAAKKGCCH
jgi:RNA polymerase sigma factor (sigma-70 family)